MTKREMFHFIATINADSSEIVEFCNHEIELLSKKSSKSGATKTQKENLLVQDTLRKELAILDKPVTITEFQDLSPYASTLSNQKISAMFRQMDDVVKVFEKKKSYFSLRTPKDEEEDVIKEELEDQSLSKQFIKGVSHFRDTLLFFYFWT